MGRKVAPVSQPEAERAQQLCQAAMEHPNGVTVYCPTRASAMSMRELIYRGRRFYRQRAAAREQTDISPVSVVDMRIIEEAGRFALRIFPPGQFSRDDVEIVRTHDKQPIELPLPTSIGYNSPVDPDTEHTWLFTLLLEQLEKHRTGLEVVRKLFDLEAATKELLDLGVHPHQEPASLRTELEQKRKVYALEELEK